MIDPLEAAIKVLMRRAELSALAGRIANKHRYNDAWTTAQAGLVVVLDDSDPDWYVPKLSVRLEMQCFGADDAAAMDTWMRLVEISRTLSREAVLTSQGEALVYSFLPESGPSYLPDPELTMLSRVLSFWRVQVSENKL